MHAVIPHYMKKITSWAPNNVRIQGMIITQCLGGTTFLEANGRGDREKGLQRETKKGDPSANPLQVEM